MSPVKGCIGGTELSHGPPGKRYCIPKVFIVCHLLLCRVQSVILEKSLPSSQLQLHGIIRDRGFSHSQGINSLPHKGIIGERREIKAFCYLSGVDVSEIMY